MIRCTHYTNGWDPRSESFVITIHEDDSSSLKEPLPPFPGRTPAKLWKVPMWLPTLGKLAVVPERKYPSPLDSKTWFRTPCTLQKETYELLHSGGLVLVIIESRFITWHRCARSRAPIQIGLEEHSAKVFRSIIWVLSRVSLRGHFACS